MAAMSVIAASLMLLSQTETYSSMNYRLMSQARYGAESGVHKATNYLLYTYPATAPGTAGDPITNYDITKSPVLCVAGGCSALNQPVILSANANQASNYPVGTVQAAFALAAAGALPAGNTSVVFAPYAKLISMQQLNVYGGGPQTIQTWQIVSTGTITQGKTAQAEVSAIVETPKFPASMYAAFATSATCGALDFHGQDTQTDSYDSAPLALLPPGTPPTSSQYGGNVGTNGNLSEGGGADIYGMPSSLHRHQPSTATSTRCRPAAALPSRPFAVDSQRHHPPPAAVASGGDGAYRRAYGQCQATSYGRTHVRTHSAALRVGDATVNANSTPTLAPSWR
jgi:hypothetical protein